MATIKCIFVVEFNSGKTALLRRIVHDKFEPTSPTVGVEFDLIEIPGIQHRMTAWNLAGAPRFQNIMELYYKDSQVVFIVIDASKETDVGKWVFRSRRLSRDAKIVLVFTKVDLPMFYSTREIELMKTHYHVFDACMVSSKEMNRNDILSTIGLVFHTIHPRESCLHDENADTQWDGILCCVVQ